MTTRFLLGVDGGQGHTEAVIADEAGVVLSRGESRGSTDMTHPDSEPQFERAVCEAVDAALTPLAVKRSGVVFRAAHFGLSGGPEMREPVIRRLLSVQRLSLAEDTSNALWSVTRGADGAVVISGSGSIGFGKRGDRTCRVGGWGHILGDEGSGVDLGSRALRHTFQAVDGRQRAGWLAREVLKRSGCASYWDLHDAVYSGTLDLRWITRLAESVDRGVGKDPVCRTLLEEAADDLVGIAIRVISQLRLSNSVCGYVGKVFRSETVLRKFKRSLKKKYPRLQVVAPRLTPAEGALAIALDLLQQPLEAGKKEHTLSHSRR